MFLSLPQSIQIQICCCYGNLHLMLKNLYCPLSLELSTEVWHSWAPLPVSGAVHRVTGTGAQVWESRKFFLTPLPSPTVLLLVGRKTNQPKNSQKPTNTHKPAKNHHHTPAAGSAPWANLGEGETKQGCYPQLLCSQKHMLTAAETFQENHS